MKPKHFNPPPPRIRPVKPKPRTKKQCREDYERAKMLCAANAGETETTTAARRENGSYRRYAAA